MKRILALLLACLLLMPVALMEATERDIVEPEAEVAIEAQVKETKLSIGEDGVIEHEVAESLPAMNASASPEIEDIVLNHTGLVTLKVGEKLQLKYTLVPEGAKGDITWIAQLPKIISVSKKGLVKAKEAGTSFAIARAENGVIGVVDIKVVDPKIKAEGGLAIDKKRFPDKIFRNFVQFQYDTDNDGCLSEGEIEAADFIELNGHHNPDSMKITSLAGIETFTGLKELYMYRLNKLTSLDTSKNAKLEILFLGEMPGIKKVSTLKNKALTELYIHDLPKLSSVDVSANKKLVSLIVKDVPKLANLNVKNNAKLEEMEVRGSAVKSLTVSGKSALKTLWVNENPKLTKLDASNNAKLTKLVCVENEKLTRVDVSKDARLEDLVCQDNEKLPKLDVSACTALNHLDCGGNRLTKLNLTKSTMLEHLDCGGNQLTTLNVSKCKKLKTLVCEGNRLESLDVTHNPKLEELVCVDNPLTRLNISKCGALVELVTGEHPAASDPRKDRDPKPGRWLWYSVDHGALLGIDPGDVLVGVETPKVVFIGENSEYTAAVGEAFMVYPENRRIKSYKSSKPGIASVKDGLVTPLKPGASKITLTTMTGDILTLSLTVKAA